MTEFIVIVRRLWMNEHGHGETCTSDLTRFEKNRDAQKHGFKTVGSDDFNIGKLVDGQLVDVLWMSESIDSDPELMTEMAKELCL